MLTAASIRSTGLGSDVLRGNLDKITLGLDGSLEVNGWARRPAGSGRWATASDGRHRGGWEGNLLGGGQRVTTWWVAHVRPRRPRETYCLSDTVPSALTCSPFCWSENGFVSFLCLRL